MKRILSATYELFGGIAPDYDPLEAIEEFPKGKGEEPEDDARPE